MTKVTWKHEPDEHDYPAAAGYLDLVADAGRVAAIVAALEVAPISTKKAKDLLRASALPLLPENNEHVAEDLRRVRDGHPLSPVLIVRGDLTVGAPAQIADGYHRVCASYHLDENTEIPCRIVGFDE